MSSCLDYCDIGEALYHDPRTPPLDTDECLCEDCYVNACVDVISEVLAEAPTALRGKIMVAVVE